MFWLFDNSNKYNFLQIFPYYEKFKDSGAGCINLLYNFTTDNTTHITNNIDYPLPDLNLLESLKISYTIKIKDSYIQYSNDSSTITFKIENEFVKETDELNIIKIPYFKWKYVRTDNHKLPNVTAKNYDFYYQNVSFTLYKINENKLFVIEKINNITKKYILEKI